jgi:hypothetical protein
MDVVLGRQPPDRQPIRIPIPPDLLAAVPSQQLLNPRRRAIEHASSVCGYAV